MLSRLFGAISLALTCVLFSTLAAFASDATTLVVPVGDWTGQAAAAFGSILVAVVLWGLRRLPGAIGQQLATKQAEQLLSMAVAYGLNAVAGAARGKVLSVDVGNEVVASALGYAIDHGPDKLIAWLGGEAAIREKILARINLGADAQIVADVIEPVTGALFAASKG